ncbi:MAG: DNA polymerase III subunit delta [Chloroflexi bacterium]|nr:DNA polymerase III subunit delta [Chloroflexota bacterium]
MLYLIYGADSFSAEEALREIKAGLGDPEMLSANTTVLDGGAASIEEITAACGTVPFLAEHRLVVVKGLIAKGEPQPPGRGRTSSGKASGPSPRELAGALKECAAGMPPSTVLAFVDGVLTASNPILSALSPLAGVREFRPLKGRELQRWIERRVAGAGASIVHGAVRLLADLAGSDLWTLASEIEKLTLYCRGRAIGEDDVNLLVSEVREANVFAMIDATLEGRSGQALRLLYRLIAGGSAGPQILSLLSRQLRMIMLARDLLGQGLSPAQVRTRLGIASDYVLQKVLGQARAHSQGQLERSYRRLLDADLSIKRGRLTEETAMDLLIAELSRSA